MLLNQPRGQAAQDSKEGTFSLSTHQRVHHPVGVPRARLDEAAGRGRSSALLSRRLPWGPQPCLERCQGGATEQLGQRSGARKGAQATLGSMALPGQREAGHRGPGEAEGGEPPTAGGLWGWWS